MGGSSCPVVPAWSRYKQLQNIGAGSFGQVYLVEGVLDEGGLKGKHVVKRVHVADLEDEELLSAVNEVQVLSLLDHCNVVGYRDHFVDHEGNLNIVMEHCSLGDLSKHIEKKRSSSTHFSQDEIAFLTFQLFQGVKYIHSLDIIHRDLKPANIFLTKDSTLKIADFGISKLVNTSVAQSIVGTPFYIAPEVCESKPYTNKADVWSAGCVLYELAALEKPFNGTNILAVVKKVTDGKYSPLNRRYNKLQRMVKKMLVVEPEQRSSISRLIEEFFTSVGAGLDLSPNGINRNDVTTTYQEWAAKLNSTHSNSAPAPRDKDTRRQQRRRETVLGKIPDIEFHLLPSQKCLLVEEGAIPPVTNIKYRDGMSDSEGARPVERSGRRPSQRFSMPDLHVKPSRRNSERKVSSVTPKPRKQKKCPKNNKTLTPPRTPAGYGDAPYVSAGLTTPLPSETDALADERDSDGYSNDAFERYEEDDLLGNVPKELKISDEEWDKIRLAIEIDQKTDEQANLVKQKRKGRTK